MTLKSRGVVALDGEKMKQAINSEAWVTNVTQKHLPLWGRFQRHWRQRTEFEDSNLRRIKITKSQLDCSAADCELETRVNFSQTRTEVRLKEGCQKSGPLTSSLSAQSLSAHSPTVTMDQVQVSVVNSEQ
eukprot:4671922-Amphidinium_carterae.2